MFQLPDLLGLYHQNHAVTFGVVLEKRHEISPDLIIMENKVLAMRSVREFWITELLWLIITVLLWLISKFIFENFGQQWKKNSSTGSREISVLFPILCQWEQLLTQVKVR